MKREIDILDATPSKRIFLSIIADYDLNKSICELVDNGLDVWVRNGKKRNVTIQITLDQAQQTILIEDDAGGLPRENLRFIVGPGQTGTEPSDETIGIFGVGAKRAVVALAQDIRIRTRYNRQSTFEVNFDDEWIANDEWELPLYEVDAISPGRTMVNLQRLRMQITAETTEHLRKHLSAVYARFLLNSGVTIELNGTPIAPTFFDQWSYPPKYTPRKYSGSINATDGRSVAVEVTAGLSNESSPAAGEYGVYFYCNERLIARAVKTFDVGFTRGLAGLPHPKVSLVRVLVVLNGDARDMPWNSSKSDISAKHYLMLQIHDWLVEVVKDYAYLSRTWMGDWPAKVFKYDTGQIEHVAIPDFPTARKSFLPPLPKARPRYGELVTQKNKLLANKKPWIKGLIEGVIAADLIAKQKLEQRNRIALIVLDSTLEIGFKEYLVNESGGRYSDRRLFEIFSNRSQVQAEVQKYVNIPADTWKKIDHYYRLRCKLVHERATSAISDADLRNYRSVVENVLGTLFGARFSL